MVLSNTKKTIVGAIACVIGFLMIAIVPIYALFLIFAFFAGCFAIAHIVALYRAKDVEFDLKIDETE